MIQFDEICDRNKYLKNNKLGSQKYGQIMTSKSDESSKLT